MEVNVPTAPASEGAFPGAVPVLTDYEEYVKWKDAKKAREDKRSTIEAARAMLRKVGVTCICAKAHRGRRGGERGAYHRNYY